MIRQLIGQATVLKHSKPESRLSDGCALSLGDVKVKRRAFGLLGVSDQSSDQMDQKVNRAAVSGVLDLTDIFELIVDGFNQRPLT